MRSNKVFSVLKGVYCRKWYVGKGRVKIVS